MLEDDSLDFSIGAFDTDSFDENLEISMRMRIRRKFQKWYESLQITTASAR